MTNLTLSQVQREMSHEIQLQLQKLLRETRKPTVLEIVSKCETEMLFLVEEESNFVRVRELNISKKVPKSKQREFDSNSFPVIFETFLILLSLLASFSW